MRKYRSGLCALLALAVILSFCGCDRTAGDAPAEMGGEELTAPSEEAADEPSAAVSIPPNPYEGRSDLVILNWEEYVNRPHEIQKGTALNYAVPNDVLSQLPWNCVSEGWLTGNIYEGLLYMYMNDPEDIRGCIAESWTHSDDYLTWTFQIRDGVKFHDGTVCDASAVAKSWDFYKEASPASFTNLNMVAWEAISSKALVITLSTPCAYFETALTRLYIVSPTALEKYSINDNGAAVGSGPYYIDAYTRGASIILKANPNYDLEEKMPCIETVNFKIFRDQEDIVNALLSKDIDGANIRFENNYFINSHYINSFQYLRENGYDGNLAVCLSDVNPMWFNANKVEAFQAHEVREAICRFIDFGAINGLIYNGMGCVQDSLWAKGSSGYVQTDQFYYDPDEGHALLASVGIVPSDIEFDVIYADNYKDMFEAVQKELKKANVEMDLEHADPAYNYTPLLSGNWSIIFAGSTYSNASPFSPWRFILKQDAFIKLCWQDVYDPELYQKMLSEYDAMTAAVTWDEMLAHCNQLTAYVQDDFGAIGGVQSPAFLALGNNFKNGVYFSEQHDIQLYYLYQ